MTNAHSSTITTTSAEQTELLGEHLSNYINGDNVLELIGDLGAGKTQLVRGIARGAHSTSQVQSPSFMLKREYSGENYDIHHFDFYRLENPGVMLEELRESLDNPNVVVVIEWARSSKDILPDSTVTIHIESPAETKRTITISGLESAQELADDFNN